MIEYKSPVNLIPLLENRGSRTVTGMSIMSKIAVGMNHLLDHNLVRDELMLSHLSPRSYNFRRRFSVSRSNGAKKLFSDSSMLTAVDFLVLH